MIFVVHQHHPHSSRMRSSHPVTRLFPTSILSCLNTSDNSYNRYIDNKKALMIFLSLMLLYSVYEVTPSTIQTIIIVYTVFFISTLSPSPKMSHAKTLCEYLYQLLSFCKSIPSSNNFFAFSLVYTSFTDP